MNNTSYAAEKSLGSPATEDWWNSKVSPEIFILEDATLRAAFDKQDWRLDRFSAEIERLENPKTSSTGTSSRAYATWKDRLYNPVNGLNCELRSAVLDASSQSILFRWDRFDSQRGPNWPSASTQVRLEQGQLIFSGTLKNDSEATITTLSWPVLRGFGAPQRGGFS